jgi:hypothetical protein
MTVKVDFKAAAKNLTEAARANDVKGVERYFGHATSANIFVNSAVLKAAAESKSYEALERMLEISGKEADGIVCPYSFGLGADWERVADIAKTDERVQAALNRYDEQTNKNIERLLEVVRLLEVTKDTDEAPVQKGFFQRLGLW